MLIERLGNGRGEVEQGRATGDTDGDGCLQGLRHAYGIEARRTFISYRVAPDVGTLVEVMHNGSIPAAGTDYRMTDAMRHQQRCEDIDAFFVTIHTNLFQTGLRFFAWCRAWPRSPAIRVPPHCPSTVRRRHRDDSSC